MRHFFCTGAIAFLLIYGCSRPAPDSSRQPPPADVDSQASVVEQAEEDNESLEKLTIVILPDRSSPERTEKIAALQQYLVETLAIPVELNVASDYENAVEQLVNGTVNMAYLGPLTYIQAKEQNPSIEAIAAPIDENSGRPWYTGVIIGHTDITTLEDLKGRRFSFVNDASTSGFLLPSYEFKNLDIDPERDFAAVHFGETHDQTLQLLLQGKVEAIAINRATYNKALETDILDSEKIQLLWESDPITNAPIVVSGSVPESFKPILQKALIEAPAGLVSVSVSEAQGYTIVEDGDYETIRQLYQNYQQQAQEEDSGV
ncbi:phosphate/phosphite/phosphonate ABC transporter substrate-binding protein [[Limnothrix rosea] IAM M-220]|uniref:phosphate/phosphite/phosphonate ABC transporter substrate-binding protein n=1 Tax=[Limnothrix rosea] IAM M-220 TaxID=454133 RepID=UPI000966116E|nr:phosphate/phosphite/phosphonate ABC transporter substrate-binding protein [[Limnothrix rosea] IAM M-220]OKH17027.1 hypothetical protein NIES208_11095 [[Limnothrix rosea] IAM M-220]